MKPPRISKFVEHVMPDASLEEKAAATERWFSLLRTLNQIAARRERADSDESKGDGRVEDIFKDA